MAASVQRVCVKKSALNMGSTQSGIVELEFRTRGLDDSVSGSLLLKVVGSDSKKFDIGDVFPCEIPSADRAR